MVDHVLTFPAVKWTLKVPVAADRPIDRLAVPPLAPSVMLIPPLVYKSPNWSKTLTVNVVLFVLYMYGV